ncbi:hypothetical protein E2320_006462 [Naja naja]|nr:hypothetical protein E2320_006462 [Naja naja]
MLFPFFSQRKTTIRSIPQILQLFKKIPFQRNKWEAKTPTLHCSLTKKVASLLAQESACERERRQKKGLSTPSK